MYANGDAGGLDLRGTWREVCGEGIEIGKYRVEYMNRYNVGAQDSSQVRKQGRVRVHTVLQN